MSSKNELQEYFQRRKKSIPSYDTFKTGGSDHEPLWTSHVKIYNGGIFSSGPQKNKKQAELKAAEEALKKLEENGLDPEYTHNFSFSDKKINILVDIENKPGFISEFIDSVKTKNVKIIGFLSCGSSLKRKMEERGITKDKRVELITIPSIRSDGADVGMCVYTGYLLGSSNALAYIIVSGDKFAGALGDCIEDYLKVLPIPPRSPCPKRLETCVCRDLEEVVEKLDCLEKFKSFVG